MIAWISQRNIRFWLVVIALALTIVALCVPRVRLYGHAFDVLAVVDITGSMNVRDYDDGTVTRLEAAKTALRDLVARLPCRTRVGLAVFTSRRVFLLLAPMEACKNYASLESSIAALDWRMAWDADSYITTGLHDALEQARLLETDLVFFTDGHEAPPLHHSGPPHFLGMRGAVKGLLVGVGKDVKLPIPKFDKDGNLIGTYGADDVPHENRHGAPPEDAHLREGWHPRNAPWGGQPAVGDEHLSSVRAAHLKVLASQTGLVYVHMANIHSGDALLRALSKTAKRRSVERLSDIRKYPALTALLLIVVLYALLPFF